MAEKLQIRIKAIDNAEPVPFIVDDVLVDFDDKRSQAALSSLAVLAKKTQVILFTHHTQVVDQAKKLPKYVQGPTHVQVHEL